MLLGSIHTGAGRCSGVTRQSGSGNRWGMQMYESWGGAWDNMAQGCKRRMTMQCTDERGAGQTYNADRGTDDENWA